MSEHRKSTRTAGQSFVELMNTPTKGGRSARKKGKRGRSESKLEGIARRHAEAAMKGDVESAALLLKMHAHSKKNGEIKVETIYVEE